MELPLTLQQPGGILKKAFPKVGDGYSNREIAERLVVTLHTIKKHTSDIYGKLGVKSRTRAIARARELGLIHCS